MEAIHANAVGGLEVGLDQRLQHFYPALGGILLEAAFGRERLARHTYQPGGLANPAGVPQGLQHV
ncbi:MAG: hypothetical protein LC804_10545 [Acidobacteria bacterium]|nr:hypothetical protein [Acidobacteriota bacterium]